MTADERQDVIDKLLAKQKFDGGWSFGNLCPDRYPFKSDSDRKNPPSDAYATGFVVYVLRQAGLPAARPELVAGANWLMKNQRASGRWFTPSAHAGHHPETGKGTRDLYIMNAGTAFAVLALKACQTHATGEAKTESAAR